MFLRTLLAAGAVAMLAGCPSGPSSLAERRSSLAATPQLRCPDGRCGDPNGIGIYAAEGGAAGIGTSEKLLITHFINTRSAVRFAGRYIDDGSQTWRWLSEAGTVFGADYGEAHPEAPRMTVRAIRENHTEPAWTLIDADGKTRVVAGDDLGRLTLYISFDLPGHGPRQYALDFDSAEHTDRVARYNLRWRELGSDRQPKQYCLATKPALQRAGHAASPAAPDQVVFQQGIDVDPDTGRVARDPDTESHVTLSCALGAPATVYGWGYDYRAPADTFYFDAAIQMKRASYCGDDRHYTVTGTRIVIADDKGLNPEHRTQSPEDVEAWWTPTGASCVNLANVRHREQLLNPSKELTCPGRITPLPACPAPSETGPRSRYLVDGPARSAP